jgi:hypothetical protein
VRRSSVGPLSYNVIVADRVDDIEVGKVVFVRVIVSVPRDNVKRRVVLSRNVHPLDNETT